MEVLILVGIGVVIWLLLRKQGLKVALVEAEPQRPKSESRKSAERDLAQAITDNMLVTVLIGLADAPRAKPATIVAKVRADHLAMFGVEKSRADSSLSVRSAVALYRMIVLASIEAATRGDEDPSIARIADGVEEAMEHYGVRPDIDPEKLEKLLRLLVASFVNDVERAGVGTLPRRVQRAREKLAAVEAEIASIS